MATPTYQDAFEIVHHEDGIVAIALKLQPDESLSWGHLYAFVRLADDWLSRKDVTALCYQLIQTDSDSNKDPDYKAWIKSVQQELDNSDNFTNFCDRIQKIRTYQKPLIGLVLENCFGNHLAWMLWADYRIAIGAGGKIGFPETAFGMLPSLGSISRMLQLWDEDFTLRLATQTTNYNISDALALGIVDEQVETVEDALAHIKSYSTKSTTDQQQTKAIISEPQLKLPPPRINFLFPGVIATQKLIADYKSSAAFDKLLEQEYDLYFKSIHSESVTAMIRTNYYGIRGAKEQTKRIAEKTSREIQRMAVIGAGMMGSGIAYEAARAGLQVTLLDTEIAKADHGKDYAQKVTDKLVAQGKMQPNKQSALLEQIYTSENFDDLKTADILIEAVFEDITLKTKLIADISPNLAAQTVFASNTTSLPIGQLAQASQNPAAFIGLHFFSPVDRMPLVEVILGKETDESTINAALKTIHLLNKISIVVQDGPGFFTSRIFFNYLLEGITMVLEGIPASMVEKAAKKAGFPVGPLLVLDEISLPLMLHVYEQLPTLHGAQQAAYALLKEMISAGKTGRKGNAGFYPYDENGKRGNLVDETRTGEAATIDLDVLGKRLLHVVALDAFRCLSDGIIAQPIDGDLGSVLGIGYAPHTGGVFAHIDQVGLAKFVSECDEFASYGDQWQVPESLKDLATQDYRFYNGFESNWNPS